MGLADTAKLVVDLSLKGNFTGQIGKAMGGLDKFDRKASRAFQAGQQIGTGIQRGAALAVVGVGILATQVGAGLRSLIELEKATAQTNAVIKSTGGVAGISAAEVGRLAEKYESMNALVGDEFIRAGSNMLLTFTNIRRKAFEPALEAVLNMNTALGRGPEGLTTTALQVGKALNDPTKGLTTLRRAGVQFTAAQVKKIKSLQKEGKLYEAQKIIIAELDKEFGESFLGQGGTTAGKVAKFGDAIEDLQRNLAVTLLPAVGNVADALSTLLQDPSVQKGAEDLGKEIGKLFSVDNVKTGAKIVGDVISSIRDAAPTIGRGLGAAATAIGAVISAFSKLPPEVQQLAIGALAVNKLTGGLLTNIAGGILSGVKTITAGHVTVVGKSVGGVPGGAVAGGAAKGGLGLLSKVFLVGEAIGLAAAVVGVQQAISAQSTAHAQDIHGIQNAFLKTNPSTEAIKNALAGVDQGISDLTSNPLNVLVQGSALDELQEMRGELSAALQVREPFRNPDRDEPAPTKGNSIAELAAPLGTVRDNTGAVIPAAISTAAASAVVASDRLGAGVASQAAQTRVTTRAGAQQVASTTRSASYINAAIIAGATWAASAAIIGAIFAARPVVNVTNVTKNNTVQQRYGPGTGSSGQNTPGGGF